ncbi:MAG: thioredoxin domain-containing protein [Actinobacteria bacterium]|nr:thioredoxin domain-containing protein [Actinomycetota bacterium]
MVAFVIAVGVVFSILSNRPNSSKAIPSSVSAANGKAIVFNAGLKNKPVVDIWEDLQCPVCARFEQTNGEHIQKLITEKRAVVNFHLLSFIGPESILAANALACSADEDKFLALHKYLYATQGAENSGIWSNEGLISAAKEAGLSTSTFSSCVNSGKYTNWVSDVGDEGAAKGINSTPTVFVNGKELDRKTQYFDLAGFSAAVEG